MRTYEALLTEDEQKPFAVIDPPFMVNAEALAAWQEVSGLYILKCLQRRLGWVSFEGKTLLDLGCGVRFARTIYNLDLPFGLYVGVDVNREAIDWLKANARDPRFRFAHLDAPNALFNPNGAANTASALRDLDLPECDAACAFSVITHQAPPEARLTLQQLRAVTPRLYFTGRVDRTIDGFAEQNPDIPGHLSTYHPDALFDLVESEGWRVDAIYDTSLNTLQNSAFLCTRV